MRTLLLTLVIIALPVAAWAEDSLGPLRTAREAAVAERSRVARDQAAMEQALAGVNQVIEARKALGPIVADAALEEVLRKHRELSDRATELSREARRASARVLQATQALVDALDREIERFARRARRRTREGRIARARVRELLAERGRYALGPIGGGCVLPEVKLSPSDGREEARAKADLLKDALDRCRRRIESVDRRLTRLREDRKLLQEAADFREEGEIFDEESRRRLQTRVETAVAGTPRNRTGGDTAFEGGGGAPSPIAGTPGPGGGPTGGGVQPPAADAETTKAVSTLRQAQVDATLGGPRYGSMEEEISDLARRRIDLGKAADRIRQAHEDLVQRARSLEKGR